MPSIVVLSTPIKIIKMRSSKLIVKNIPQKVMAKFGFECRFRDLIYVDVVIFS